MFLLSAGTELSEVLPATAVTITDTPSTAASVRIKDLRLMDLKFIKLFLSFVSFSLFYYIIIYVFLKKFKKYLNIQQNPREIC